MVVMGLDPGERRVGIALGDDETGMALPRETLERGRDLEAVARAVAERARQEGAERIVVGLPLKLDGTEGLAARRARAFGTAVEREAGLPVVYWDERLTTAQAERSLGEIGVRGRDRRRVVDQAAAALMLQSYLDARDDRRWRDDASDEGPGGDDAADDGERSGEG